MIGNMDKNFGYLQYLQCNIHLIIIPPSQQDGRRYSGIIIPPSKMAEGTQSSGSVSITNSDCKNDKTETNIATSAFLFNNEGNFAWKGDTNLPASAVLN